MLKEVKRYKSNLDIPFFAKPDYGLAIKSKYDQVKSRAREQLVVSRNWVKAIKEKRQYSVFSDRTDKQGFKILLNRSGKEIKRDEQFFYNLTEEAK